MTTYTENFSETLREVDLFVNQEIEKRFSNPFHLDEAVLYGLDYVRGEVPFIVKIETAKDIYDMLSDVDTAIKLYQQGFESFAVVTCGWAAPISGDDDVDEIRPSEHKERRRVRVMVMSHKGEMGSTLRFSDEKSVTYDEGNALGALAVAIADLHELLAVLYKANPSQNERQLP